MNLSDTFKPTGELEIVVRGPDGNIKETIKAKNLVVAAGKTYIASRIVGTSSGIMSYMAIGTSTATPVSTDTQLGTEAGRVALASGTNSANAITYTATFPAGTGTSTSPGIQEAGILNASSNGTLLCRTVFPSVAKASGDSIAITWVVTVS
jgi:hypothetical protein